MRYEKLDVDSEPANLQKAWGKHSGGMGSECTVLTKEIVKQKIKTTKKKLVHEKQKTVFM